jgi:hypothetical protein
MMIDDFTEQLSSVEKILKTSSEFPRVCFHLSTPGEFGDKIEIEIILAEV